jgi:hypothetical protein
MENLSTELALILGQLLFSLWAVPEMHLDYWVLECGHSLIIVCTYSEGPWEKGITLAAAERRLAAPSAGEVKSSVVVEVSEVQVSPVPATPLLRLALVNGGLAGASEDRSVVPSLWYVRYGIVWAKRLDVRWQRHPGG